MLQNKAMDRYLRLLDRNPANIKLLKTSAVPGGQAEIAPPRPRREAESKWRFELVVGLERAPEALEEAN
jgi:hypothetical protein